MKKFWHGEGCPCVPRSATVFFLTTLKTSSKCFGHTDILRYFVYLLQGYDDRSDDSDGDRTPPRASRRIPVTDLDEDDYNDPDYYQDNLKKIDTKAKVGITWLQ